MKRVPQMELETPLRPRAVAEAVWEEASIWLEQPLPRRWLRELIAEANTIYAHNPRFRRKLRSNGSTGRDWLWVFTRHWLAALIHERRPHLHARLPVSYNTGHPLPPKSATDAHRQTRALKIRPFHLRLPASNAYTFAPAAHFYEQ
jgi:hypothetical protein